MRLRLLLVAALGCVTLPCSAQLIASNLLFNAIEPCRILDTRTAGGILAAGTTRSITVVGLTNYSAQGGFPGDCHIPGFTSGGAPQVQAVMANIVAVGSTAAGDLRAWPNAGSPVNSSVINFAETTANHGLNIANGIILPVSQLSQNNDLTLAADVGSTHVVIDVTGYFSAETDANGANLFIGLNAGLITQQSGGTLNVGIGDQVLSENTSGCHDVAIGSSSMSHNGPGSYTVAIGYNTLGVHTSGDYNVAVGAEALEGSQTGSQNTAVGAQALGNTTSGAGNVAVGYWAGLNNAASASNNIDLGNFGNSSDSGTMRLGSAAQTSTFIAGVRGVTTGANNSSAVVIDANGQLGTMSSSRTMKEDITDMAEASHRVLDLRPVTFRYRKAFADGTKPVQYGLVAEEVAEVFPELVAYDTQGKPETVKYHVLPALLLNEVQRQERALQQQRSDLEIRLTAQRAETVQAQARADRFEQQLAAQQEMIETLRKQLDALAQRTATTTGTEASVSTEHPQR